MNAQGGVSSGGYEQRINPDVAVITGISDVVVQQNAKIFTTCAEGALLLCILEQAVFDFEPADSQVNNRFQGGFVVRRLLLYFRFRDVGFSIGENDQVDLRLFNA